MRIPEGLADPRVSSTALFRLVNTPDKLCGSAAVSDGKYFKKNGFD